VGYEYEEVVQLIVKTDQMNADLKRAKELFDKGAAEIGKIDVKIKAEDFIIDLKKIEAERIKSEERQQKEFKRMRAEAVKAKAIEDAKAIKDAEQAYLLSTSIRVKKEAEEAKALHQYRVAMDKALAREEYDIAKELFRYRREAERELQAQRTADIKQQAALQRQAAQFSNIFAPGGSPLKTGAASTISPSTLNASAALRTGAGAAGALGAYPAAGALYASANAMQVLGISTVGTTTALAGLGAVSAVAIPIGLIFAGKEFNEELAKMSTLLGSATDDATVFSAKLDATAKSAIKLSAEFNIGTTEVIRAFKEALSSGIEGDDLERFTRGAATLATGLGVSLTESANILTGFKDSYQLSIGQLAKANDILFNTVNYGKVNVDQLVTNFGRLLPIGKAAGLKIEDLATGVAVLTRRGLTASQAVTAMTQVVNGLISPSDKAKKALDAMGISTGDAAFATKDLLGVVEQIRAATGGSGELLGTLFNEERAKRGISSLTDSIDLIKQVRTGMDEVGTAAIASDRAMNTLWTNLGKKISELTGPIKKFGSDLADSLNGVFFGTDAEQASMKKHYANELKDYQDFFDSYIQTGITNRAQLEKIANDSPMAIKTKHAGLYGAKDYESIDNAKELGIALDAALAKVKDRATEAISTVNDAMNKLDIDTHKFIEDMAKVSNPVEKQSKIEAKQFGERATDDQKQKLDDLKEELETKQELLDVETKQRQIDVEKQVSERKNTYLTPAKDRLEQAQKSGDYGAITTAQAELKLAQENVDDFVKSLKQRLESSDPFGPMVNQITRLNKQIVTLQENVAGQDTRKEREAKEKKDKADKEAIIKDTHEFNSIVERLYREDTSNYERAQKDREAIFKRINKEIENEAKKSMNLQADIANKILNSKMAQHADDPGAQVRMGRGARDAALNELKNLSGEGKDRNAFDAAVKKYQEASDLIRNAMRNIDDRRAERNYQNDEAALGKLDQDFNGKFLDNKRAEAMSKSERDNSVSVRSPQQLAKDASKELQIDRKIEQVVLDAKIKLDVTGNLSEKTKADLVGEIVAKVQQAWKNKNPPPSNYDPKDRKVTSITSVDE
jgi:TP901 family phage tail tape measure protein